jgi:hypothetical protein
MVMESPWKKFLHTVLKEDFDDLLGEYYRLRHMFQENGIKDRQLERGIGVTNDMLLQREYLIKLVSKIKKTLKKYGLIENETEFLDYLTEFFYKIDSETPLNN